MKSNIHILQKLKRNSIILIPYLPFAVGCLFEFNAGCSVKEPPHGCSQTPYVSPDASKESRDELIKITWSWFNLISVLQAPPSTCVELAKWVCASSAFSAQTNNKERFDRDICMKTMMKAADDIQPHARDIMCSSGFLTTLSALDSLRSDDSKQEEPGFCKIIFPFMLLNATERGGGLNSRQLGRFPR